jgi:hypothetical protein
MANKMLIEKARGGFVIHFPGTDEQPLIASCLRGMVETVIGYFVPSREARRWQVVIDEPPGEMGETHGK